ncbi:MAG TPA: cytochrome c3 family protein [Pyrinomonadaceae bacterium]|nr:cytochrome c3 family protein [Pyrinomonadaceae bacterium]
MTSFWPSWSNRLGTLPRLLFLLIAVLALFTAAEAQKKSSCIECHRRLDDPRLSTPAKLFGNDIHGSRGLSCNDCHGGDPNDDSKEGAKDPRKGYLGKPKKLDIPAYCGKCHSDANLMKRFNPSLRVDQEREYYTSVHGKLLQAGEERVATCVSCHSVHGIRAVNDPLSTVYPLNVAQTCAGCHADANLMRSFGIPTDQFEKYKSSVHAQALNEKQDLSAPTCNDCHGNHGATPPGIASVANVCGQCHARQAELFQTSPHKAAFDQKQLAECVTCHSNHAIAKPSDQLIGTEQGTLCTGCHHAGDKGFIAAGMMRSRINDLIASIDKSTSILNRAERAGMEVSKPKFELKNATDALTHARVMIHSSSPAEVEKIIGPGLEVSSKGYQAGLDALAERRFRRGGLAVSLVFILFLALLVYLKIRQIESRQSATE